MFKDTEMMMSGIKDSPPSSSPEGPQWGCPGIKMDIYHSLWHSFSTITNNRDGPEKNGYILDEIYLYT